MEGPAHCYRVVAAASLLPRRCRCLVATASLPLPRPIDVMAYHVDGPGPAGHSRLIAGQLPLAKVEPVYRACLQGDRQE